MNNITKLTGFALASTAATLLVSGCSTTTETTGAKSTAKAATVKCSGINACKGQSACTTASSACKGHNACKGQGWIKKTQAECDAAGGKVK